MSRLSNGELIIITSLVRLWAGGIGSVRVELRGRVATLFGWAVGVNPREKSQTQSASIVWPLDTATLAFLAGTPRPEEPARSGIEGFVPRYPVASTEEIEAAIAASSISPFKGEIDWHGDDPAHGEGREYWTKYIGPQ